MKGILAISIILCFALLIACSESDPDESGDIPDASTGPGEPCTEDELALNPDTSGCLPSPTDYTPQDNGSANDMWAPCISDDNAYHQIEANVSSIARVAAYDAIGALLWENMNVQADDFIAARMRFEEEQGLGSRVARRWDPHYPSPAEGSCEDPGVATANPDYCVGPAVLQPLITSAFAAGAQGEEMIVNAAKIEAALEWFLYVSANKEATTCAETPKDCDSCWAYYSGGTPRESPVGLAADIYRFIPLAHNRAYDGVLAVRCWRDIDPAVPAENPNLQAQAIEQLDVALLHGMAMLVRQRFVALGCATGEYQQGALEALRIMVPLLDRETRERNPATADLLLSEIDKQAPDVAVESVLSALDAIYVCP
ncbi:MAG: hypothetical protein QNJ97_14035 [Myxococcota bacterium]|nr:hypothetical protein [Myxococcota bacterium]